jgi:hypothetical protein
MSDIGPHPTLADAIRRAVELAVAEIHVMIPARVERVDLQKGLVDAKPLVRDVIDVDGVRQSVSVPVVTNVPICSPGACGFRLTFPVAVGDTCQLVFSDRSLDLWLVRGGEVDPLDDRRHHLSDATAWFGLRDFSHPWRGVDSHAMTLGSNDGANHPAAWGDAVAQALDILKTAMNKHVHTSGDKGTPTSPPTSGTVGTLPKVESETVRIKG